MLIFLRSNRFFSIQINKQERRTPMQKTIGFSLRNHKPVRLDLAEHRGSLFGSERYLSLMLHRLAYNAVQTGWKVIYLDFQPTDTEAATFTATMQRGKPKRVRCFPYEAYDGLGMAKPPQALIQQLLQLASLPQEPYDQHIAILGLTEQLQRSHTLPSSLGALIQQLYQRAPEQASLLKQIRSRDYIGLPLRFASLDALIGQSLNGGWTLADVDACYISLAAWSRPETARLHARFFLSELACYLTELCTNQSVLVLLRHPELLLEPGEITSLYSHIEPYGSLFVATGTPADLGPGERQIVASSSVQIYLSGSAPQRPWWQRWQKNPNGDEALLIQDGRSRRIYIAPIPLEATALVGSTYQLRSADTQSLTFDTRDFLLPSHADPTTEPIPALPRFAHKVHAKSNSKGNTHQ
jgi:hypothetical protein